MEPVVKTKLVRIGNSRGVRIPKPLLEQAGLEGEVLLRLVDSGIVIEAAKPERSGWSEAAAVLRERGEDALDDALPTAFDDSEWVWE